MAPSSLFSLQRQIIAITLLLVLTGQVLLFSATGVMGIQKYDSEFYFVTRQGLATVIGLALMFLLSRFPHRWLYRCAYVLMWIQIALVGATWLSSAGHEAMGASRWLRLGGIAFQPSEFARITVSIFLARFLAQQHLKHWTRKQLVIWGVPFLLLLGVVLKQPDLGTTAILASIALGMVFTAGMSLRVFAAIVSASSIAVGLLMYLAPYRRRRLFAFLDPWSDPQGIGFQTIQSFLSFHSGKTLGVGLGNGNSKLFFLPEVHTDFIFALVGEELGFVGACVVLAAFIYLVYLLLRSALSTREPFGAYLSVGLALTILLPITINLMGVTGLLPVKGLPLPFFSWGRSAMIANLAALGILLNILKDSATISRR